MLDDQLDMAERERLSIYVCRHYSNIANQKPAQPEGVAPSEVPDREVFSRNSQKSAIVGDDVTILHMCVDLYG